MLYLPFHRRHRHRIVRVTLLAWVLALLAGMANACLLQVPGAGSIASMASVQEVSHQQGLSGYRAGHDEDTADAVKAGCVKFCVDEASTLVKAKTSQLDLPTPVCVACIDWRAQSAPVVAAQGHAAEQPAPRGPPLVIRFLRLTI